MRRRQLFEFHDRPWFPAFLRDQVTDDLQLILNFVSLYPIILPRLRQALRDAGARRILDLCSGAGGPWLKLYPLLQRGRSFPVELCLTDKYPNVQAFHRASALSGGGIHFRADSVDATQVPGELDGFRTVFTSFHHFRPDQARSILQDAVRRRQGIGIFEAPGRHLVTIFLVFLIPFADCLLAPLRRPFLWSRLIWTYVIPVIPFVLWFDGIVSCLRVYSPRELAGLTAALSPNDYSWEIGQERPHLFSVPVTYLIGLPPTEGAK